MSAKKPEAELKMKHTKKILTPLVGVVMGSKTDWETMGHAVAILEEFEVPCEYRVVSAHRMPDVMAAYAKDAGSRGLMAIIAGAGGAAHLPGMIAAQTTIPVLGVPVKSRTMEGFDSLLSIVQMPAGIPVATFVWPRPRLPRNVSWSFPRSSLAPIDCERKGIARRERHRGSALNLASRGSGCSAYRDGLWSCW